MAVRKDGCSSDEKLVLLAQNGDEGAEEELLQRYKEKVKIRSRLFFMLGGDNEDIVQEGMIGLFNAIQSYKPDAGASFATFAELCVNRRIISAIKTAGRNKYAPLNESLSYDAEAETGSILDTLTAGTDTDPEAKVLLAETIELMLSEDAHLLSAMERKVLTHLVAGESKEDIVASLGISMKSLGNAITRIRTKTGKFFEK